MRLAERLVRHWLSKQSKGTLLLETGDHAESFGNPSHPPAAHAVIHSPEFFKRACRHGHLGVVESYLEHEWDCDDLPAFFRFFLDNDCSRYSAAKMVANWTRNLPHLLWHLRRPNSRRQSRPNIQAHYDLGNDFFGAFLDSSRTYSCGIFPEPESDLELAQATKLRRVCDLLDLDPQHQLLEIGCGWGSFLSHAATARGCHLTGTTLSEEQFEFVQQRADSESWDPLLTLRRDDYRDLTGVFDRIVSIEMIEAVGHRYLPTFFRKIRDLLKPGGRMVLQAIVYLAPDHWRYRHSVDFIQAYVFPGGELPSPTSMKNAINKTPGLELRAQHDIGPHYVTTLRHWRSRLETRWADLRTWGYPERLLRLWRYYFAYCEAGFAAGRLSDVQWVLERTDG